MLKRFGRGKRSRNVIGSSWINARFGRPALTLEPLESRCLLTATVFSMYTAFPNPTNAASVNYTVTFDDNVTGVDNTDFAVLADGPTGASIVSTTLLNSFTYFVVVNTGSGDGTIWLKLVDDNSITDFASDPLGGAAIGDGDFTGPPHTIDKTPSVVSFLPQLPNPTNAQTASFGIAFDSPVTGVDISDFQLISSGGITGASITSVTGSNTNRVVTVNTGTGSGTIALKLVDNDSIIGPGPLGGVGTGNGDYTSNPLTVDKPTVLSIVPFDDNPTSVIYSVTFSQGVSGVDNSDFAILANGPTGTSIVSTTPVSSSLYKVVVNTGSGSGTIALKLVDDNSIINAANNPLGGAAIGDGDFTAQPYSVRTSAPYGKNKVVGARFETAYTFQVSDFGFNDPNDTPPDDFLTVQITALPTAGSLAIDGVAVAQDAFITVSDIAAGKLKFTPVANFVGPGHANIRFKVQDDGGTMNGRLDTDQVSNTITIDVKPSLPPGLSFPALNSLPGAAATLYLDFDGHFGDAYFGTAYEPESGGTPPATTPAFNSDFDPTSFNETELATIEDIWAVVAEDFAPFNLNVTTVEPPTFASRVAQRVVIGGNSPTAFILGTGGHFVTATGYTAPAYVYSGSYAGLWVSDVISHEAGHSFGLAHQSSYDQSGNLVQEYYTGLGYGRAPIMGQGNLWWYGNTNSLTEFQDDMAVIAGTENGFGYRPDDHGNTMSTATALVNGVATNGIITTTTTTTTTADVDYFRLEIEDDISRVTLTVSPAEFINLPGSTFETPTPFKLQVPNLDSTLELRGEDGQLIASAAPSDSFGATIVTHLQPGVYYVAVASQGEYGNVGQYTITAAAVADVVGTVFYDANYNGVFDTGEDGLSGWQLYDDRNQNGQLDAPYQSAWNSTDTPLPLANDSDLWSELTTDGLLPGTIVDINVRVTANVAGSGFVLYAPDGSLVILMEFDAGSGGQFIDTRFDDDAALYADQGASPFTGTFKPLQNLALFNGKDPNGVWKLYAYNLTGTEGALVNWSLEITTTGEYTATTNAEGQYNFAFPVDGPRHIRQVGQTGYVQTSPAGEVYDIVTGGPMIPGLDFGNAPPAVLNRALFYNGSGSSTRYDGNDLAINASDDNAIATDKTAYLWEDAGAATFANVSSYTKGINGIMVDIFGSHPNITADDFIFRVGNNNSPDTWATANAPTSISVRAGAGVSGSDRVTIIWDSGAPFKEWLEVITLANADTGLAQKDGHPTGHADAFFFGNAVGNTGLGDTSVNSLVNAADEIAIRNNPAYLFENIPITNLYDVNRSASVNATDENAARNNATNPATVLKYLNLTSAPAAPEADGDSVSGDEDVVSGDGDVADGGIASSLSAPASTSLTDSVPKWLSNRIESIYLSSIDINIGTPARLFQYLHDANTPRTRALLQKFDAVADALGLDDELLELLLGNLLAK